MLAGGAACISVNVAFAVFSHRHWRESQQAKQAPIKTCIADQVAGGSGRGFDSCRYRPRGVVSVVGCVPPVWANAGAVAYVIATAAGAK